MPEEEVERSILRRVHRPKNADNFDSLRLFGAVLIIFDHSHTLAGVPSPMFAGEKSGILGFAVFFIVGGYLIARSWLADPNVARYAARRALRIMPGLIACVTVTAVVLGPLVTSLRVSDYFGDPGFRAYFSNLAMYPNYALPGVFSGNIMPGAVNGSLWSLPVEILVYMLCPLLLLVPFVRIRNCILLLSTVTVCALSARLVLIAPMTDPPVVYGTNVGSALGILPYFMIGLCFAAFRLERFLNIQVGAILMAIVALAGLARISSQLLLVVILPYAVLSFAMTEKPAFWMASRFGDFSYGLYLYGFPIQQSVVHATDSRAGHVAVFLITLPIAFAAAACSWHLVEKRALRLKPRRPRASSSP